jgi:hypothetical protein
LGTFYNPKIVTDGLILHLDAGNKKSYAEGSSVWNDLSKNKYTASLVNNAIYNSINGGAVSFYTGANSYVQIPSRLVQDDFTLCVWFQSSGNSVAGSQWYQGHGLIDCEVSTIVNDYGLSYLNNKAAFGIGSPDQTIQSSALINDGEWKYIVATRTKSTGYGTIYINGNINASGTFTNQNSLTAPSNTYIGSSNGGVGSYGPPSGSVAVAQIYNKVLTPSEILQNFYAARERFGL